MAWPAARDALNAAITAAAPSTLEDHKPGSYRYSREMDTARASERPPTSRTFWWELIEGHDRILYRVGGQWTSATFDLVVCLRGGSQPEHLYETAIADHRTLAGVLLNEANWGRPSSTITKVGAGPGLLPFTIQPIPNAVLLRIRVAIDFQ